MQTAPAGTHTHTAARTVRTIPGIASPYFLPTTAPRRPARLRAIDGVPLVLPRTRRNLDHFGTTRSQHGDGYCPQVLAVWASQIPGYVVTAEYLGHACETDQSGAPDMLNRLVEPGDPDNADPVVTPTPCIRRYYREKLLPETWPRSSVRITPPAHRS